MRKRQNLMRAMAIAMTMGITLQPTAAAAAETENDFLMDESSEGEYEDVYEKEETRDYSAFAACNTLGDADKPITVSPDEEGHYRYVGNMEIEGIKISVDQTVKDTFTVKVRNNSQNVFRFESNFNASPDEFLSDWIWNNHVQASLPSGTTYEPVMLKPGQECSLEIPADKGRLGKRQVITINNAFIYEPGSGIPFVASTLQFVVDPAEQEYEETKPEKLWYILGTDDGVTVEAKQVSAEEWTVTYRNAGERKRFGNEESATWTLKTDQGEYTCVLPSAIALPGSGNNVLSLNFDGAQGVPQSLSVDEVGLLTRGNEELNYDDAAFETKSASFDTVEELPAGKADADSYETVQTKEYDSYDSFSEYITDDIREFVDACNFDAFDTDVWIWDPDYYKDEDIVTSTATVNDSYYEIRYIDGASGNMWVSIEPFMDETDWEDNKILIYTIAHTFNPNVTETDVERVVDYVLLHEGIAWLDDAGTTVVRMDEDGNYTVGYGYAEQESESENMNA